MNQKNLYDAFAKIDEDLTEKSFTEKKKTRSPAVKRSALVAASLAVLIIAFGVTALLGGFSPKPALLPATDPAQASGAPSQGSGNTSDPGLNTLKLSKMSCLDLMAGIVPNDIEASSLPVPSGGAATDFAVELFKKSRVGGKNNLISPISALSALSMTANGAQNDTLSQMEDVLGAKVSDLNAFFYNFNKSLKADRNGVLNSANSVWFGTDREVEVLKSFLQTNADFYSADVFGVPFSDASTVEKINSWVKTKTKGMIPSVIDEIPENVFMYLVNAVAFDAKWEKQFDEKLIYPDVFTTTNNRTHNVSMMHSLETLYIEDENASGFIKPYEGGRYAFVALLPDEGVKIGDYIASLDGETLAALINSPQETTVHAGVPKFKYDKSMSLKEILKKMGMTDAFDPDTADFSALGSAAGNIYIDSVTQNTFIDLNEKGTRAAAATAVAMAAESAVEISAEKAVILNRPFVYLIVDLETGAPLFIGSVETFE